MSALTKFKQSPWIWVPTLYFAEGVPYFIVNSISVMMFTKMGVPNGAMSFFTTLLYFPWFLKGLWSPIVDVVKTKRWWIISMQILLTAALILLTLSLPHPDASTIKAGTTSMSIFTISCIHWHSQCVLSCCIGVWTRCLSSHCRPF